jgi:hypothetical protein
MSHAATAHSTRHALGPGKKFVATRRDFIRSDINPKLAWFLIQLEDRAMDRTRGFDDPWGIVYDADLTDLGSEDTIRRLWLKAEQGGYLQRVQIKDASGHVTGRIGFVWYCRPSDHPVATPATFGRAAADLRAAVEGRKGQARTVRMTPADPGTPRSFAGERPAILRGNAPQFCGGNQGPPYSERARGLEEYTEKTTTTRAGESLSFFDPSLQNQEPERPSTTEPLGPVSTDQTSAEPCTHVEAKAPPSVPELPVELAVHQTLLMAIITRFAAGFGKPLDQARTLLIGLWGEFRTRAESRGFTFEVRWLGEALDETEKAKAGRKIKESPWVYFRGVLAKYAEQGGPLREDPTEHQARATLEELASQGWTIVLKCDGTAARGKIREDPCPWEDLPESLRRRLKEQEGPIRALLKARETGSQSWNARC